MTSAEAEENIQIQLAYTASKAFVTSFYSDLHNNRPKLPQYYKADANVAWNGNQLNGGDDIKRLFETMPPTHYEVQCYDAQPLLPNGRGQCSILMMANGYVKFGDDKDAPLRGFTESLVLEPDNSSPPNFLISQQNFRFVF